MVVYPNNTNARLLSYQVGGFSCSFRKAPMDVPDRTLVRYLLFGIGMLLAPVVQLAIFASSLLLDVRGTPMKDTPADKDLTLPILRSCL